MENARLMMPLFYKGNFNNGGRKMRAVLEREITDGTDTYRLWRRAGKPELESPRNEKDAYILYVELGEYLASLRMTDFYLTCHCGFQAAVASLYGDEKGRGQYFDSLRRSGGDDALLAALKLEEEKIQELGDDPARQTGYIKAILDEHIAAYRSAKENGGETFPDFTGALALRELPMCVKLSAAYKKKCEARERERRASIDAEDTAYCEERNRTAEQTVQAAIRTIREGGVLHNETVEFYRSRYNSSVSSIFNYLFRLYQVEVPLRTQGWVNQKLDNATILNGRCSRLQFKGNKRSQGSQRFFDCMNELIQAVAANGEPMSA